MFKITPVAEGETDKAARRASRVSFSPGTALALGYRFQVGKKLTGQLQPRHRLGQVGQLQFRCRLKRQVASVQVQISHSSQLHSRCTFQVQTWQVGQLQSRYRF